MSNMEHKRVSFKVAISLKEAGYPQECDIYYHVPPKYQDIGLEVAQPTYIDVWLWLWREKKIAIPADYFGYENNYWESCVPIGNDKFEFFSSKEGPEEVIEKAIEYLVDKNLIK